MVLESLGESLREGIRKLASKVLIDTKGFDEFIRDFQRSLIQGDVDVSLVAELTNRIKNRVLKEKAFSRKELIIKVVYEELVKFLGGEVKQLSAAKKPYKILLVGVFGCGKTTTAGKLAKWFKKKGLNPCLLALDTFRPAAIDQLHQVSVKAGVKVFSNTKEKKPNKIVKEFSDQFKKFDVIIADSAGRDSLDKSLVKEITDINKEFKPDETLLVIPADIGQAAKPQAQAFAKSLNITGVIISKMDGTAKGGGALTACAVSGAPVKVIGVGEGIDDIEMFNPKRFVGRLLGMGDLESLLEKAKEELDEKEVKKVGEKLLTGNFNLIDLHTQLKAMDKMGSISKMLSFLPGFGMAGIPKDLINVQQDKLKLFKHVMNSMTLEELENPKSLNRPRLERIAKGSGTEVSDIRELLKQYNQMKNLVKKLKGDNLKNVMKKLGVKDLKQLEGLSGGLGS